MKLTAHIKLLPDESQHAMLLETLERCNTACNYISGRIWKNKVFSSFKTHKLVYHDVRERFNLSAQVVIRCIGKTSDSYKAGKKKRRSFRKHGAQPYDSRILTYFTDRGEVSIWCLGGRQRMSFETGAHQRELLKFQQGESDLVYIDGVFYLLATCDLPDGEEGILEGVLGVDFGISQIATDSDGESWSGEKIDAVRERYVRLRAELQSKKTKSAKRKLKKISKRESRYRKDVNHVISKRLVQKAKDTHRAIILEDLSGIRKRTTVRKSQRARHHGWSFYQLRQFIEYKAKLAGVPVEKIDAAYTSRTCSECGHCEKANRKSQSEFICKHCSFSINADLNAAINIASKAVVNQPIVAAAALAA